MNNEERKDLINKIKRAVDDGYHYRTDYPPYQIAPWDDRNRYREYVFGILDEFAELGKEADEHKRA